MHDRENVIRGLQIERECVSRDCDRDCGKCDLVQEREWLLTVYDDAIAMLKEQDELLKHEYWRGYNNGRADERGLQEGTIMQTFSPD